jgi:N,N'-diacetyllegionaminate synthase
MHTKSFVNAGNNKQRKSKNTFLNIDYLYKMRTYIIAEAGVNHNGSLELAKKLVDVAVEAGADVVKFQTFKTEKVVTRNAPRAEYQNKNTGDNESQFEMIKKLELSESDHDVLVKYCDEKKIEFLSTAFDHPSIDLLTKYKLEAFKIPSGEITNLPYLKRIATLKKKVILSTGMSDLGEIEDALDVLIEYGVPRQNITVLHCNTEYPSPFQDVNLLAMLTIKEAFKVNIGYSDHTPGIEVPIAAVALGATIIEKHFTLDKNLPGPDHKASLDAAELKAMVKGIRNIEIALGDGIKRPSASERKNIVIARRSIHLESDLKAGHTLREEDLVMKRPGDGISPMKINDVIGRTINKSLQADHKLGYADFANI